MESTAWIDAVGSLSESRVRNLCPVMEKSGIGVVPREIGADADAGVLVFDRVDTSVLEVVRENSQERRAHIFGVFSTPTHYSAGAAWSLLGSGAADAWCWEGSSELLAQQLGVRIERRRAVDDLVSSPMVRNNLVGRSPTWRAFLRQVVEVARFTRASVLVSGESGTGKELVARLIHTLDCRSDEGELVILDCTTVVQSFPEASSSDMSAGPLP